MSVTCSICNGAVNVENEMSCDLCRGIIHTTCSNLSRLEVQCIRSKNRKLIYYCPTCNDFKQQLAKMNELSSLVSSLQEEVKALKSERVISSAATVDNIDSPIVDSVLQEMAEREKRKSNLVIFNLPEMENGSRSDQISEDVSSVRDILANLGVVVDQVHPLRLGKFDPTHQHRKRPIKITLSSSGLVSSALRESSKLKSIDKYKSIFLTNDKTPLQSSLYKAVKQQLNQRIAAGETNIYIRHFNGTPKIVKRNNPVN